MSTQAESFFAIRCDFPDCGELYDGGEFTYLSEPRGYALEAAQDGWATDAGAEGDEDFCPMHTTVVACPAEGMIYDSEGEFCQWCEDHATDVHLAPLEDTWENRLAIVAHRMVAAAERELDVLGRRLRDDLGPRGRLAERTDRALIETWESACRALEPDVTAQTLFDLRHGRPRRDRPIRTTAPAVEPETFWGRVARIARDHNVSQAEAVRVAGAEERFEAAKASRHQTTEPAALAADTKGRARADHS